jgi:polyisoprenoid-binding protein YceI
MSIVARPRIAVLASLCALTFASVAAAKLARTGGASASFRAVGPGGTHIEGKTSELQLADDGTNVTVTVPLGNLRTGIDLRDRHMKEKYLEVDKFPTATLTVARGSLKLPTADAEVKDSAQGTMTLHGVSKPVTFRYGAKLEDGVNAVHGSVRVNMKEFGIEVPSYLGVTVKPDVDVSVRFKATDR